jgi:hypothetical protein
MAVARHSRRVSGAFGSRHPRAASSTFKTDNSRSSPRLPPIAPLFVTEHAGRVGAPGRRRRCGAHLLIGARGRQRTATSGHAQPVEIPAPSYRPGLGITGRANETERVMRALLLTITAATFLLAETNHPKTPSPGGPVPIPYPNTATTEKGASTKDTKPAKNSFSSEPTSGGGRPSRR